MSIIRTGAFALIGLAVLGAGGFAALGQYSKRGSAPGLTGGTLAPCPASPNCVSSEAGTEAAKRVEPLASASWDALPGAIAAMGGQVTRREDGYIAAEFTSRVFGFVDDLELRRGEDAVHVRSASRVGHSDNGVNAARVAQLRSRLDD
ncbi:DUF1499 domain-containing protein [Erythrobacter sp.]|uniref:DUF1499 domain-containing protein n=1 Tax=Erythrobacter sp. TaxID=1042 RepID=UPI001425D925|nr:DUF1499 domain-containing protein [Erythrobacter sp.]QIQ85903.1 MAG: DUF1499 domain-containing protein [Erythrobacter sp.]